MGVNTVAENGLKQGIRVPNSEKLGYEVPVNEFVTDFVDHNPAAAPFLVTANRVHTGEFEKLDLKDDEAALQLRMLADNCSNILLQARDDDVKRQACESVIETVVRLQNPVYATDQTEVRNEAFLMHKRFEDDKAIKFFTGQATLEEVDAVPDPSEELLTEFDDYVQEHYDLEGMRTQAALTLAPMIEPIAMQEFVEVSGVAPEVDLSITHAVKRLSSFVTSRLVQLRVA